MLTTSRAIHSAATCLLVILLLIQTSEAATAKRKNGIQRQSDDNDDTDLWFSLGSSTNSRTHAIIQCLDDSYCDRKEFCHGGEGYKICLPCRRARRRCHRDEMCCRGNVCRNGMCVPRGTTKDEAMKMNWASSEDISQHSRDTVVKGHDGESCRDHGDCQQGLCCAQHFSSKICKSYLEEHDVCTKHPEKHNIFERCPCFDGLTCKREASGRTRLHTCQVVKGHQRQAAATPTRLVNVELGGHQAGKNTTYEIIH